MGTDTETLTLTLTQRLAQSDTMNVLHSLLPCLLIATVTASTKQEFKLMLETLRQKTMDGIRFTDLSLPAYMKPETLTITHMDPESKKYFGEHKPVQYIKFSSNGAITVHFIEGQQRDLIKGSELRTRSGGLEGIDGEILEQIFPAEFIENFEASQSLVDTSGNSSSTQEGSGRIVNAGNSGNNGGGFLSPGGLFLGLLVSVVIYTVN